MARHNLRSEAQQQAAQEFQGPKHAIRHDTHQEVKSYNSGARAQAAGFAAAERHARSAGLQGRDLRSLIKELALRETDAYSAAALGAKTARQDAHSELVDLRSQQAAAAQGYEADAQAAAQEARQKRLSEIADNRESDRRAKRDFLLDLKDETTGADAGGGGENALTPTQRRAQAKTAHDAHFWTKQFFQGARDDPEGPGDPQSWDASVWAGLEGAVAEKIGDTRVAQNAIKALQQHVIPPPPTDDGTPAITSGLEAVAALARPADPRAALLKRIKQAGAGVGAPAFNAAAFLGPR